MKKLLLTLSIILGVTFTGTALAADASCDLSQEYKVFTSAIQNSYNSQEDIQIVIQKELSARASLLSAAIDCAREDIIVLKNQVLPDDNDSTKQVKERVVQSLDEAIHFYDLKKDSIRDQGIRGTKDLAKEIKAWRDNNYDQLSGRVKNFILWSSNQPFFDTASDRLSQSQIVVASLRILEGEDSQEIYYKAKSGLMTAQDLNRKTGEAIANNVSSEETYKMIRDSLGALSDTYKSFLEISNKLNKSSAPEEVTPANSSSTTDNSSSTSSA